MGTEYMVYSNMNKFKEVYQLTFNRIDCNCEIEDFYTKPSMDMVHLWVTLKYAKTYGSPVFDKSTVLFFAGYEEKWFNPIQYTKEFIPKLVEWNQVIFDKKNMKVGFGKKGFIFKKPIREFKVERFWGDIPEKRYSKIDNDCWFYDLSKDRINLVISK